MKNNVPLDQTFTITTLLRKAKPKPTASIALAFGTPNFPTLVNKQQVSSCTKMAAKVAVVTGSNKGIGFAIVRGLAKAFQGDVILTARNEERGLKAVEDLKLEGFEVKFHQLDIDHEARVSRHLKDP